MDTELARELLDSCSAEIRHHIDVAVESLRSDTRLLVKEIGLINERLSRLGEVLREEIRQIRIEVIGIRAEVNETIAHREAVTDGSQGSERSVDPW